MRFTISSTVLSSQLQTLSRVIASKNSSPILECFLFEVRSGQLVITTSDSENAMQTTLPLDSQEGEGDFAVRAQILLDSTKELPEQPLCVEVNLETSTIKVTYQGGEYNFTTMPADEYPRLVTLGESVSVFTIDAGVLSASIGRSVFATAQEEIRPVMNGIYFDLKEDALSIVATDGHKLVRNRYYNIKTETPASFILPKKPATLLKNVLARDGGDVVIKFAEGKAEVRYDGGVLTCRLIVGRYPNYDSVIPTDNPNLLTVDRRLLLGALKRVLPFGNKSSQLVKFRLDAGQVQLSSEDIDYATKAQETLACDYTGQQMSIGFKGTAMTEILGNLEADSVVMELADPSRPGIVVPAEQQGDEQVLMLIMPMLLNEQI